MVCYIPQESKAKITSDTDQAVNALNGRIDFTNKDLLRAFFRWKCPYFLGVFSVFSPLAFCGVM